MKKIKYFVLTIFMIGLCGPIQATDDSSAMVPLGRSVLSPVVEFHEEIQGILVEVALIDIIYSFFWVTTPPMYLSSPTSFLGISSYGCRP